MLIDRQFDVIGRISLSVGFKFGRCPFQFFEDPSYSFLVTFSHDGMIVLDGNNIGIVTKTKSNRWIIVRDSYPNCCNRTLELFPLKWKKTSLFG